MKIFCIGGSGLVGSRVISLLQNKYTFINLTRENNVDITVPETLESIASDTSHSIVLLLAAKTDVDGCEKDKPLAENGDAWKINVEGTANVLHACKKGKKKIIYISTDFVFDGENPPVDGYAEDSIPSPVNWYGKTKYEGELLVRNAGIPYLILRIGFPFRASFPVKQDFFQAMYNKLKKNERVTAIADQLITPTFIDDIAGALPPLIDHDQTGIFHVFGSQWLSPYDAAKFIVEEFHFDASLVSEITRNTVYANRAPRPFKSCVNNGKIVNLGITMHTFIDSLKIIHTQL